MAGDFYKLLGTQSLGTFSAVDPSVHIPSRLPPINGSRARRATHCRLGCRTHSAQACSARWLWSIQEKLRGTRFTSTGGFEDFESEDILEVEEEELLILLSARKAGAKMILLPTGPSRQNLIAQ
jgi:hypothetical protein